MKWRKVIVESKDTGTRNVYYFFKLFGKMFQLSLLHEGKIKLKKVKEKNNEN